MKNTNERKTNNKKWREYFKQLLAVKREDAETGKRKMEINQ